jgi:ATP-dependent RNA helicase RhlE
MSFSNLGLSLPLLEAVRIETYENPFPIQIKAIPAILQKKDLWALAPTGSGKTAAYVLPILDMFQRKTAVKSRAVAALVLVPTRELALQVDQTVKTFANSLPRNVKSMAVYGGVSINPQMIHLYGTDLLIGTPGRLLDLLSKKAVDLSKLEILVLDEADKMLHLGFKEEVDEILSRLPKKRQNILFSATMEESLAGLSTRLLHEPVRIEIGQDTVSPAQIKQSAYLVTPENKGPLLRFLITEGNWEQVLVFASSKRAADNLAAKLKKHGIQARSFHGDKSQAARTESLRNFKEGNLRVLVATDLASRGIDIQFLPHVVNYELPRSPKDYIHRIGRTGRAGSAGEAISLISEGDAHHFKVIQKKMKRMVELIDSTNLGF